MKQLEGPGRGKADQEPNEAQQPSEVPKIEEKRKKRLCDPLFECWFSLTTSCDCASNWPVLSRNSLSSRAFSMRRGPTYRQGVN
jgi:hypothetical protein